MGSLIKAKRWTKAVGTLAAGALVGVLAGCRPSPAPATDPKFFRPESFETQTQSAGGATGETAPDFSWWFEDREVVTHPVSESTDDELWYDWRGRPLRLASTPSATPEQIRDAHERFNGTPAIFGSLSATKEEKEVLAQTHRVSYERLNEDQWIALGSPFDHEVVHVFQVPILPLKDRPKNQQHTYLTSEFVFAAVSSHVDVIFAPDAVRAGQTGVIPDAFVPLFAATGERMTCTPLQITFLYPTFQEAIVEEYLVANSSKGILRSFYPRDAKTLEFYDEVGRE